MTINCIAVDDEPSGLNRIVNCIENNTNLTLKYSTLNSTHAKKFLNTNSIDLLITDIEMPNYNGFDLAENLNQPVIFVTAYQNFALQAMGKNPVAVLQKPYSNEQFANAIEKVVLNYKITKQDELDKNLLAKYNLLTTSQKEVVKLMGLGKTSKEICDITFNSKRTIDRHREDVKEKLGFYKPNELFFFAYEMAKMLSEN